MRFVPFLVAGWLFLPPVALAVLAGVAFGWGVPVALALGFGFMLWSSARPKREVGKVRAAMEYAVAALLCAVVGGLLVGGLGAIFGFVLGFLARLPEPTPGPSFRFLRRSKTK
jgi:hypothetical protein